MCFGVLISPAFVPSAHRSPKPLELKLKERCKLPIGCWELNQSSRRAGSVLITEPTLQPGVLFKNILMFPLPVGLLFSYGQKRQGSTSMARMKS